MGNLFAYIIQILAKRALLFMVLFCGVVLFLVNGLSKLNIQEDLYSIFPKSKEFKDLSDIIQKNALNRQVVFSIANTDDLELNEARLSEIETELKAQFSARITHIETRKEVNERALITYLQRESVLHLSTEDYAHIGTQLSEDSLNAQLNRVSDRLNNANSIFIQRIFALDPLGISANHLSSIRPDKSSKNAYQLKDGLLITTDNKRIVFFGEIEINNKETKLLEQLNSDLLAFKHKLNSKGNTQFDYFGTFQIAVENTKQVKADTYLTSILSIVLILGLLFVFYRNILIPIYFILPACFGVLAGLGMAGYVQPNISAISLATSSVLLGIVLDYSFHFFTHFKHTGNVIQTIKEICVPLVLGSFTTVAALAALLFAESVILQDFGLISLFTLLGSAFFTLIFQPVLLLLTKVKLRKSEKKSSFKLPKIAVKLSVWVLILFSVFVLFKGVGIDFDSDLNNLSYHPDYLVQKEQKYTGIQPKKQKKFYVVSTGSSRELAIETNEKLYQHLNAKQKELKIQELISSAPYLPSFQSVNRAYKKWGNYWQAQNPRFETRFKKQAQLVGFSDQAFQPFFSWTKSRTFNYAEGDQLLTELGLNRLQYTSDGKEKYITSIVLDRSKISECKAIIHSVPNTFIVDISEISEMMLFTVQNDFNFLLYFSALLVFISLLVIYGRIELALFAFMPMILGWIIILGLAPMLGIKFNFVNIIICTFIFGLGDDFSIFTTDGLLQQYRTGSKAYLSYRSAIILSGLTTIIGMGVLIFAKHPAIHSIGWISILGISTIMFITLFVQPLLFDFFVFKRLEAKRRIVSFFVFCYSILLFTYFFVGALLLNVFLLFVLIPFPATRAKKRRFLVFLISKLAKSTIYAGVYVKKRNCAASLDFSEPKLIIANHSSFLDILLVLMIHPKTLIMVKSWVYNSPVFGLFIRYAGFPFAKEGTIDNLDTIKARIAEGYSIVIFPEGTRSKTGEMNRFHKGAFYLAHELKMDIQPIALIGTHEVNPKNDFAIQPGELIIQPLEVIPYAVEQNFSVQAKAAKKHMQAGILQWKNEHAKSKFWQPILLSNYLLKGPILEWYVRVKWALERKNFEKYEEEISNASTIYDLGCGYGYLSYYLHYRNPSRKIVAIDYDADKIAVAQNGVYDSKQLHFSCADIKTIEFEQFDALFLTDVLHYLTAEEQAELLQKAVENLAEGGIIFIRDGLSDNLKNHRFTRLTEFLSTKLLKFNQTENPLHFFSEADMINFAHQNNLKYTRINHSNTTSNALIKLSK